MGFPGSPQGSHAEVLRRFGITVRGRKALCPFHDERHPSLRIFIGQDGKERFNCFGCGVKGNAADLSEYLSTTNTQRPLSPLTSSVASQ